MLIHTDLFDLAAQLGATDALGSYPTEMEAFEAITERAGRLVLATDRLVSHLADAYDEARASAQSELELAAV